MTSTGFGSTSAPVKISSLVEPPVSNVDAGEGYLAIKVNDRNGTGLPGIAVHADGPTMRDAQTNDAGCAVFGPVGVGSYDITFTKSGYVDDLGRSPGQLPDVAVTQDAKTVNAVKFDLGASLSVNFETSNPTNGSRDLQLGRGDRHDRGLRGPRGRYLRERHHERGHHATQPLPVQYAVQQHLHRGVRRPRSALLRGVELLRELRRRLRRQARHARLAHPPPTAAVAAAAQELDLRLVRVVVDDDGHRTDRDGHLRRRRRRRRRPTRCTSRPRTRRPAATRTAGSRRTAGAFDPGLPYGSYDLCAKVNWGSGTQYGVLNGVVLSDPKTGFASLKEINTWVSSKPSPKCRMSARRLRGKAGFTLPELLTTLWIAMVVLLAGFSLLEFVMKRSLEAEQRVEATQRGRIGMDLITRELRSQVCLDANTAPIVDGTADAITFYTDLNNSTASASRSGTR